MPAPDLARRSDARELMDASGIPYEALAACLRDLERVNRLTSAYRPTLRWIARVARAEPVGILDVGSGHGDMLRRIHAWGRRRGLALRLTGIDRDPSAAAAARRATPADWPIAYRTGDVFDLDSAERHDFVISALFTHHLSDPDLVRFIRWMESHAVRGWFVSDLHRHALPYRFVRAVFPLLRLDRMVVHDAPISIARAFTGREWRERLREAGVPAETVEIAWHMPFRYGIGRTK